MMAWYWLVIVLVGSPIVMLNIVTILFVLDYGISSMDEVFNPLTIYELHPMINVFGCILITLLGTIIFLPWAIIYWFYKLCTVGRR